MGIKEKCHRCGGNLIKDDALMWENQHYKCESCNKSHSFDPGSKCILAFPFEDYDFAILELDRMLYNIKKSYA